MRNVLSTIVTALVALAFAGAVFAADATTLPATGDTRAGQTGTTAKPVKKTKKKMKAKMAKSPRKRRRI